jgi:uncharacterized alkaline shock family protein YloU
MSDLNIVENFRTTAGKTTIAPEVLLTISRLTTLSIPEVSRMSKISGGSNRLFSKSQSDGVRIKVTDDVVYADLYVVLKNDVNIREVSREIQRKVSRAISDMVGMQVGRINIHVEDIDFSEELEAQ